MKTELFYYFYLIQETVESTSNVSNSLNNIPLPKTFSEFLGLSVILLLTSAIPVTAINAWANRKEIKDGKTKELEKKIEEKNEENYKKDVQIEILKVKLENAERNNQAYEKRLTEVCDENRQLKQMTNTGFTRQEEMYREHIAKLEQEIESLKRR